MGVCGENKKIIETKARKTISESEEIDIVEKDIDDLRDPKKEKKKNQNVINKPENKVNNKRKISKGEHFENDNNYGKERPLKDKNKTKNENKQQKKMRTRKHELKGEDKKEINSNQILEMNNNNKKESKSENKIMNDINSEILSKKDKDQIKQMIKSEVIIGSKPVPLKIANKVMKSICKITIKKKEEIAHGTGFFMKYSDKLKCLITCYHVINPDLEKENIEIEIYNNKKMKLKFKNRYIKYIEKPKDITIIEINESDEIYKDIEFLIYDLNCIKTRYPLYKDADVFSIEHPYGDDD